MKKKWRVVALSTALTATAAFAASCGGGTDSSGVPDANLKQGTYRTYTSTMPSNWNELTYQDNNDTQILYNIVSSFFEYDYEFDESLGGKFNADGTINADAIVPGGYEVKYSAATAIEDVTSSVDSKWGYTAEQKSAGGYAWKFTLRDDLKWDDGTPITAEDFVYTMQELLNPLFFNMRASTYYINMSVKGARQYLYSESDYIYETVASHGYESNAAAIEAGEELYIDLGNFYGANGAIAVTDYDLQYDDEGNVTSSALTLDYSNTFSGDWAPIDDTQVYFDPMIFDETNESNTLFEYVNDDGTIDTERMVEDKVDFSAYLFSAKMVYDAYAAYFEVGADYESTVGIRVENTNKDFSFEDVGFYSPSTYELVICLDSPIYALDEDGTLSYEAAYNFQNFPLVKEDLYESCKIAPVEGSTLWTSNYGSSVATTASWGPYKLTQFQGGHSYTLSRNDNWYGYDLEDNANQYNVTEINCLRIEGTEQQWMNFLSGATDEVGLDVGHKETYRSSRYTYYAPGTGTFGIQVYAGLDALKANGRNNGILAITEFRKALSLALNRSSYNTTVYTSHQTCLGLLGPSYYYDVENGGVYRDTVYAKEALLRVYGFTENGDGTWTDGSRQYSSYETAYDAMTGYNLEQAKVLVEQAYQELTANASEYGYDPSKQITIILGFAEQNTTYDTINSFLSSALTALLEGTSLEGKITLEYNTSFGDDWANAFRRNEYDLAASTGFTGGPFDPAGTLQCYVDPEAGLMYATWWDTTTDMMTYTMPEGDYAQSGQTYTMSVLNWYCCLNGIAERRDGMTYTFNWGSGAVDENVRLELLAKLEEYILGKYYSIQTTSEYSAVLYGAKFSNITDEYNIFMGFGGYRYMIVNYTDSEWTSFVSSQGGNLESLYRQTY